MRRGLKRLIAIICAGSFARFKPIPDEEGTETPAQAKTGSTPLASFKPIPDEEGTETKRHPVFEDVIFEASNRSPMRRGLKLAQFDATVGSEGSFKPIPDEEGTET